MRYALVLFVLLMPSVLAPAQPSSLAWQDSVHTLVLTDTLEAWGRLGGVAVDQLGFIYVSNFRDAVWQITPDGRVRLLTNSLYGASGNAVDSEGTLYQANFFANTITRIRRMGEVETFVSEGLAGPVGIAVDADDNLFVCNCQNNTISKVSPEGEVMTFASGALFNCPNGLTFDDDGMLFVVNFSNDHIVQITPDGTASRFATLPPGGNAHIAFTRGTFYVTRIRTNQVYRVTRSGEAVPFAGTGTLGFTDGAASEASFSRPNGIAVGPSGNVLYVNNLIGTWQQPERGALAVRRIRLVTLPDVLKKALASSGEAAMETVYQKYKNDAAHQDEHTLAEVDRLGYGLLNQGRVQAALTVFQLNAASYPDAWRAHASLGFAYSIVGQTDKAIEAYERSLALNADNQNARTRLQELRGN